jgi:hypothetical protein
VTLRLSEGVRLGSREAQRARCRIVAVGLEVRDDARGHIPLAGVLVRVRHAQRGPPKIVGGEVRTEVRAMAEDGAELHQPGAQEDALPLLDVLTGEHDGAVFRDDRGRDGRTGRVGPVGE